ncbi:MAG TPA: hypothetical protein VFB90_05120 [Dehalococcoidia bacterium]|nr:hypothetical protein [Dehalococcoidia bacterium]
MLVAVPTALGEHYTEGMSSNAPSTSPAANVPSSVVGVLHVYVAFDWGDEIDLEQAGRLAPGEVLSLSRRSRTPTWIGYKPPPLRFRLTQVEDGREPVPQQTLQWWHRFPNLPSQELPGFATVVQSVEATVFDFGAVSVALEVPFDLPPTGLTQLAGQLSDPATAEAVVQAARQAIAPLHAKLLPAIQRPQWDEKLWEEYFVFQLPPGQPWSPTDLLDVETGWLAGLVRLEDQPLSAEEVEEAVRLSLHYGPHDLFVPDWAAAVLLDEEYECEETLQTIEFANLQLLEYRYIDDRLDRALERAYGLIHRAARSRLPLWRRPALPLRLLGELKVEATGLFERTGNVLKLVGDQYLARVYRLLATRFHLREWERSIQRKLEVIEGVYQVVSDQTAAFRMEFLEIIVVVLIFLEIVLALVRH